MYDFGTKFLMLVEVYNGTLWQIGLFGADTITGTWRKRTAPLLSGSGQDTFDKTHVATPSFGMVNGQRLLFYCGCNPSDPAQWPFSKWSLGAALCGDPTDLI